VKGREGKESAPPLGLNPGDATASSCDVVLEARPWRRGASTPDMMASALALASGRMAFALASKVQAQLAALVLRAAYILASPFTHA